MLLALKCAQDSLPRDVPIGAVIINPETRELISSSGNMREQKNDPTNHAEINAIRQASQEIGDWRLNDLVMFTTLEPCIMCAGALIQSRIGAVVYGASDPQYGAAGSIYNFFADPRLMHNPKIIGNVLENECRQLLNNFFKERRSQIS